MMCGCGCFGCCMFLILLSITMLIATLQAMGKVEPMIPTIPCTAKGVGKPPHHLDDCVLNGASLGSFNITGDLVRCGDDFSRHVATGKVPIGTHLSFVGDISDNVLRPWHPEGGRAVCKVMIGSVSAGSLFTAIRWGLWMHYFFEQAMYIMILHFAVRCLFFPDVEDSDEGSMKSAPITLISWCMSTFVGVLAQLLGEAGLVIALLLVAPLIAVFVSEDALEFARSMFAGEEEATETTPLAAGTAAARRRPRVSWMTQQAEEPDPEADATPNEPDASPGGSPDLYRIHSGSTQSSPTARGRTVPASTASEAASGFNFKVDTNLWFAMQIGVLFGLTVGIALTMGMSLYMPTGQHILR